MYKTTFYWINYYLSKLKRNVPPSYDAYLLVILLQTINIIGVGRIVYNFTHFKIAKETATYTGIILAILLFLGNFFYLFKRRVEILKKINEYPEKKLLTSKIVFWIYVFSSFIFIVLVLEYA
jgi:hypothetical protein